MFRKKLQSCVSFLNTNLANYSSHISDPAKERGDPDISIRLPSLTAIVGQKAENANLDVLGARAKVAFSILLPVERSTTVAVAE